MTVPYDVPVVCERSGLVLVLVAVLPNHATADEEIERLAREGTKYRVQGRPCCSDCSLESTRLETVPSYCVYRPLRGPLYVPR